MNDTEKKPKLNDLVNSYRDNKAPPGFAQRVTANLEPQKPNVPGSVIAILSHTWGFHKIAVVASFAAVIFASFAIMQSVPKKQDELEIAKLKKSELSTKTQTDQSEIHKPSVENTQIAELQTETDTTTQEDKSERVTIARISAEEKKRFFSASRETDDSSLAVMTDVAEWLHEEQEVAIPDITDLPDISDIDILFETT